MDPHPTGHQQDGQRGLAECFETHRSRLRAVAHRILGSAGEADDAVQEAWLRLSRTDTEQVENLGGWLTTVVARVSLNMLRSRSTRRELPLDSGSAGPWEPPGPGGAAEGPAGGGSFGAEPEDAAVRADSVGLAMLVVLDTLSPAERLAFVLHDMFGVPFDEIAPIVERTPAATRQLASRARRRVRGTDPGTASPDGTSPGRRREIIDAFLAAARGGGFEALLTLLDPEVVVRADSVAVAIGAAPEIRGVPAVSEFLRGRSAGARPALLGGASGLVWAPGGRVKVAWSFTITGGRIAAIDLVADEEELDALQVVLL
ncbi:sigma-70 family RNA polymerase sigma factor [Streptomyces sp. YIM 98790]|uniref:sigma-70 family RNA polymerase sigma factor n=1 Tax=Streptomyces sp. YIM 98790 TaxID=2689077 RepID=UPI001407B2C6|nr:sigma-70 family RNA polymerase sigma factor [Streptomyces sp. YIM 98790]